MFTSEDLGQSSSHRELKAIYYVLLSCVEQLWQKRVKVFTDNQGAARIVSVSSSKVHLQLVATSIFDFCFSNGINLKAQWIPKLQKERADLLSRFVDKDHWRVNPSVFRLLEAKWGPHTFDRFATYSNAQLPRFKSKFASPGCSGVDALAQDWSADNNWMCPTVSLIVKSVRPLMSFSGRETLIISELPSAIFGLSYAKDILGLARLLRKCLYCLQLATYCWRVLVRSRSIGLVLLFFVVALSSECWLYV